VGLTKNKTMEKKQTAVEWLYVKLSTSSSDELVGNINNWFDQAKQMEKEQIEFTYNIGWADGHDEATNESPLFTTGEQYYNETYGCQDE
jgi:hypothetical protein